MINEVARNILGQSTAVKKLLALISKVAPIRTNVLVIGESGTGKELVARMIHDSGPLKGKAFIPVNCGAIPENLIESELFGHKRGSFTGAVNDKEGLFEAANGGTLFLDEVGELPLGMQVKLLRAIQDRTIRRVGGTQDQKIDVRIIAATNRDLEAAVARGTFREDLYYRLNVILIETPPLRVREGDVQLLAESFLKRFGERSGKSFSGFAADALAALEAYSWPGNVRELENVIERAATLEMGSEISLSSLTEQVQAAAARSGRASTKSTGNVGPESWLRVPAPDFSQGPQALQSALASVEKAYIKAALEFSGGDLKKAAALLGMTQKALKAKQN